MEVEILKLHLQEEYFHAIDAGLKKIEGRLGKSKYLNMQLGSKICFHISPPLAPRATDDTLLPLNTLHGKEGASKQIAIYCEVVKVVHYSSFKEMLEIEGFKKTLPSVDTIEQGVAIYRMFYSAEAEALYGVAAIHLHRCYSSFMCY